MGFMTPGGLTKRVRGLYLNFEEDGSTPSLPIVLVTSASISSNLGDPSAVTANTANPAGANRFLLAAVAAANAFGGAPNIVSCRYGGAGGVALPTIGASQPFFFTNGVVQLFGVVDGPDAVTNIYANWDNAFQASIGGAFFLNVNQTNPISDITTANGISDQPTQNAVLTIPNCIEGVPAVAWFGCGDTNLSGINFNDLNDSVIITFTGTGTGSLFTGGVWVMTVPSVDGDCNVEVQIVNGGEGAIDWRAIGGRLNQV